MLTYDNIRDAIAKTIPGLSQIKDLGTTKKEFPVAGRILHTAHFNTENGKAQFCAIALPSLPPLQHDELRLMTVRSEGQFNTVVYEEEDIYRGQERRDIILMNSKDIATRGLKTNAYVTITSAAGAMKNILVKPYTISVRGRR